MDDSYDRASGHRMPGFEPGVLAVGGLLILVFAGGILLLIYRCSRIPEENKQQDLLRQTPDSFLDNIQAQRGENAYQLTSAKFRERVRPEQFQRLLKRIPAFKDDYRCDQEKELDPNPAEERPRWEFRYVGNTVDGKELNFVVVVVKEENAYRVDDFKAVP
jgi:hypothetical protein